MSKITLQNLSIDTYRDAFAKGLTLSSYAEMLDPSPEGSKIDAFGRLMQEAGIVSRSMPERNIFSSQVEAFYRTNENKSLFPEFIARTLIKSMADFPLYNYLVAGRTPIDSNVYKAAYLNLDEAKNKKATEMVRVAEATDLPTAKLRLGKKALEIYKYGRAIEISYEALRRMSIDMFRLHINRIGLDAASNKVAEILTVIKDGDGNDNVAESIKMKSLDSAATKLTRDSWIKFLLGFYPNGANTVIANADGLLQILEVLYPKTEVAGKMDELLSGGLDVKTNLPQNLIGNTTLLYSPHIDKIGGKEAIYAIDRNNCISELVEIGSTINEADKFIKNQTELLTISENSGFMKMFADSAKILTIE